MCMPVLPAKMGKWQEIMDHIKSTSDFAASQKETGVHERSFVQNIPARDFLIITLEGEDPSVSWAKIAQSMPPEFAEFALDAMV